MEDLTGIPDAIPNEDLTGIPDAAPQATPARIMGGFGYTAWQTPGLISKMNRSFLETEDIDALDEKPSSFTGAAGFRPNIPIVGEIEQIVGFFSKRTAIDDAFDMMDIPAQTRVNEKANEYAETYPEREAFKKAVIEEKKAERKNIIEQMKGFEQQFEMPEDYKKSSGFLEDIARGIGSSVPSMVAGIGGMVLGGPAVSFLFSSASAYSQMHGAKIQELEGLEDVPDAERRLKAGIISGGIGAPLEGISNLFMISKVMKLNGTWTKWLVSTLQAGAGEAATEFVQQYPDTYATIMAVNPDLTSLEHLAFMMDNIGEITGEALYAGTVGGAVGILTVGVAGGGKNVVSNMLNKLVSPKQKAVNEAKVARVEQLAAKFEKDGITEPEAVEIREMVNAPETTEIQGIVNEVKKSLVFQEPIKSETRDEVIKSVKESGKFTEEQVDSYATLWDGIARNWAELEPDRTPEQWYDTWLSRFETDEAVISENQKVFQVSMDYVAEAVEENDPKAKKKKAWIKKLEDRLTELKIERNEKTVNMFTEYLKGVEGILSNPEATQEQKDKAFEGMKEMEKVVNRTLMYQDGKIPPVPALSSKEISDLARDVDYKDQQGAIETLKAKGIKFIDGYHVTGIEGGEDIKNTGIKKSDSWYGRDDAVYFFADPDDIRLAIPYLAMKIEGDKGGDVLVAHFQIPVDDIKDMEWDGFFNVGFETYSAFLIKKDVLANQITDLKPFKIPSAKDYKRGVFQEGKTPRGAIENLMTESPKIMHAFEAADPSTPIHETGHLLLEMMFQGGHEDYLVASEWAGVEYERAIGGTKVWTTEELEKFARGFEVYLMEGKAPTSRLAAVFENLKAWLLEVYKSVKALGVELNPEVREVFDRWVSTETERQNDPIREVPGWLMADDIKADMKRRELTENESWDSIEAEARKRVLGSLKAKRAKLEKKLEKEFRKEAKGMVNENPIYEMLADAKKRGLRWGDIVNDFGTDYLDDIVKRLPGVFKKGGQRVDIFTNEYGYDTADEMMQAVLGTPTKKQAEDSHYNDLWAGYEVMLEHENINAYEDVIEEEINILNEMLGGKPKARKDLKGVIRKQTGQIKDQEYQELKDGIRHDRALAKKAYSAGKKDAAKQQLEKTKKRLQALRGRVKDRDLRRKIDKQLNGPKAIWKTKTIPPQYKAYITQILSPYYNIPKTFVIQPDMSLDAFLATKEVRDENNDIIFKADEAAVNAIKEARENLPEQKRSDKGYRIPLTLEEKQAVMEPIKMLTYMGKNENKLLTEKDKKDLNDKILQLIVYSYDVFGQPEQSGDTHVLREKVGWFKKLSRKTRNYFAQLGKLEFIFDVLDGGKLDGPNAGLFEKYVDALNHEQTLGKEYADKIRSAFSPVKKIKNWASKIHIINGVTITQNGKVRNLTKEEMVMISLQSGSPSGRNALITGNGFTDEQIDAVSNEMKNQEEWSIIEDIWDAFESLYPMENEIHKKLTGVKLPRIEGRYFPLKYDAQLSRKMGEYAQKVAERDLLHEAYTRPTVESGSRIARSKGDKPPVLLKLNVIQLKLSELIHDITHQLPVRDLQKILSHKNYRKMIDNTLGEEYYNQVMPWLAHIAKPNKQRDIWERGADWLRRNTTVVALGLKFSVAAKQALSITQTVDEINRVTKSQVQGVIRTTAAMARFHVHPLANMSAVNEMSPQMANRTKSYHRDIKEVYDSMDLSVFKGSHNIRDVFFWMIQAIDKGVTYPTWMAGHELGLELYGGDNAKAVKLADKLTRKTQPSANVGDLSMMHRGGKGRSSFLKWTTMFYTFFSVYQNKVWQTQKLYKMGEINMVELMASHIWITMLPALLGGIIARRALPKGWEWVKDIYSFRLAGMPFVRDIFGNIMSGFDYSVSPVERALEVPTRLSKIATSKGKEKTGKIAREGVRGAGYIFGLPTDQALITYDGINDLMEGGGKPQRLFFRKPYKEKKKVRRGL